MGCREKNPGNVRMPQSKRAHGQPSMKCREKNPGNRKARVFSRLMEMSLNEVPGNESRQSPKTSALRFSVRTLNEVPGDESRQWPHFNTHYQQGSYRKVREVQYISSVFANNTGHERRKGHRKWSARTKKPHCERSSRKYQAIQLSLGINCHHSSIFKQREHPAQGQNVL